MKYLISVVCIIFLFTSCISIPNGYAEVNRTYQIGDTGPAGGIVFLDRGDYSKGWRYLEAAPPIFEFEANWNNAIEMAKMLNVNGFTDWRLPDRYELNFMYVNLKQKDLGGFGNGIYWSSTEEGRFVTLVIYQMFGNGVVLGADRLGRGLVSHKVRAVRQF